jgi:tRNA pseudouridine-54 N-methylase
LLTPLSEQIKILVELQKCLRKYKANGYLASRGLTTYKVVSELLPYFINGDHEGESLDYIKKRKKYGDL